MTCFKNRLDDLGSILVGRSKCPKCHHRLDFVDLFPVLSYCFLGGKCRYCKKRISAEYPIIELLTAAISLFVFGIYGVSTSSVFLFVSLCLLLVASVVDIEGKEVHLHLLVSGIITAALFRIIDHVSLGQALNMLAGMAAGAVIPFAFSIVSKETWMGWGDSFFALWIGALCGYPSVLVAVALAFISGAIFGTLYVVVRKGKKRGLSLPFGPFLAVGAFFALAYGNNMITFYLKVLGL